jgi:hypothetical protein
VVTFPLSFSASLTLPTTSRSAKGLNQLKSALDSHGGATQLDPLTERGFTFFAPVDDAWDEDIWKLVNSSKAQGVSILGNHVRTRAEIIRPAQS